MSDDTYATTPMKDKNVRAWKRERSYEEPKFLPGYAFYRAMFRLKNWQPKICEYDGAIPVNAPVDPVFQGKQEAVYSWCYLSLQIV